MSDENKLPEEEKKKRFKKPEVAFVWWKEILFFIPAIIFVYLWLGTDHSAFSGLITSLAITTLAVYFGHVIKGLIIPEFSLLTLYHKAKQEPLSASITICAVLYFLTELIKMAQIN